MLNVDTHNKKIKPWWQDPQWLAALCIGAILSLGAGALVSVNLPTTPSETLPSLRWTFLLLIYPLLEEFVFRGLVQPLIARHWPAKFSVLSIANLLTSGLFLLTHVASKGSHWLTYGVFFPSLLFGYFLDRHAHWYSALVLHMGFNLCFFLPQMVSH